MSLFRFTRPPGLKSAREHVAQAIEEMRSLNNKASEHVGTVFPKWEVSAETYTGSPAWEVINKADKWKPDLIVVGSQGRSALGRLFLGSVSQKILTEARCSVRIGRRPIVPDHAPVHLLVGVDGSPGSEAAVQAVAKRARTCLPDDWRTCLGALLLVMFAIVPNKATRPPRPCRDFFARKPNNVLLPQS